MSTLDANAKEWRPSASYMGPLELPSSSEAVAAGAASAMYPTETALPMAKRTYDAEAPEFIPGYVRDAAASAAEGAMYPAETALPRAKRTYDAEAPEFIPGYVRDAAAAAASSAAPANPHTFGSVALPTYATLATGGDAEGDSGIDWAAEFTSLMALTAKCIHNQRFGEPEAAQAAQDGSAASTTREAGTGQPLATPPLSAADAAKTSGVPPAAATTATTTTSPSKPSYAAVVSGSGSPSRGSPPPPPAAAAATASAHSAAKKSADTAVPSQKRSAAGAGAASAATTASSLADLRTSPSLHTSAAPSVVGGSLSDAGRPRHWKKQTKAQQRREFEQKSAFESFANALLHSVSPFMAPLRARTHTSLPHLKLDQRFGKNGQPQTAIAQFVVAPLITNYRPRHFHDVTPGDLMEFHYDLSQVLRVVTSAKSLHIGYGPVWKRFALPYLYLACGQYRKEVLSLCPDEVPNSRAEAMYEDDIVKDITEVVLSVEELKPLQSMSIRQAMKLRVNLAPLYDAFEAVFQPLENYMIEITDFDKVPSTFLLKTSKLEVEQKPQPIVLYGDETLWYDLPVVSRVVQLGGGATESDTLTNGTSATTTATTHTTGAAARGDVVGTSGLTVSTTRSLALSKRAEEAPDAEERSNGSASGGGGDGVNWMLVAPLALSACAVAATAAILVAKRSR